MLAAVVLGLTLGAGSSLHCVAMCGPLQAFAALDPAGASSPSRVLRYQLGRVLGYTTLGAISGAVGGGVSDLVPAWSEALLSVGLAFSLALVALQLWPRAVRPASATPTPLGLGPRAPTLRERLARLSTSLVSRARGTPLGLGLASALLPCGALAAAVLAAASTASSASGVLLMASFAATSGLVVTLAGLALGRVSFTRSPALSRAMALTLALGALVLVLRPAAPVSEGSSCHGSATMP